MMHVSIVSPPSAVKLRDRILRALRRYWPLYLMAIPGMLYFIIYKIVPIFLGAVIAFKNFTIKKGIWGSPWAQPWYQHYKYFFRSPSNVRIITNTITLSRSWWWGLLPPLIFALAISECRNKYVVRRPSRRSVTCRIFSPGR